MHAYRVYHLIINITIFKVYMNATLDVNCLKIKELQNFVLRLLYLLFIIFILHMYTNFVTL